MHTMRAFRMIRASLGVLMAVTALGACGANPATPPTPQVVKETVIVVQEVTSTPAVTASPEMTASPEVMAAPANETPSPVVPDTPQTEAMTATVAPEVTDTPPQQATSPPTSPPTESAPEPAVEPTTPAPDLIWDTLPTLTVVPLIDGDLDVSLRSTPVQFGNPDQVARVDFTVTDPGGQVVFESSDTGEPFCPFGDAGAGCTGLNLITWPGDVPPRSGQHTLAMTAYDHQGQAHTRQVTFELPERPPDVAWDQLPALATVSIIPSGGATIVNLTGKLEVTFGNPASIARVNFAIFDFDQQQVFQRLDGDVPFCIFGDANQGCRALRFNTAEWPDGAPLRKGAHVLVITAYDQQDRAVERRVPFEITALPPASVTPAAPKPVTPPVLITKPPVTLQAPPIKVIPVQPMKAVKIPGELGLQLIYPPEAKGNLSIEVKAAGPGGQAGEGFARMEIVILDSNGQVVNREEETTPKYCGFGGSATCTVIRLEPGATWPSTGIPIRADTYTVQVTVFDKSDGEQGVNVPFKVFMPGEF
jgi:hypothetical protein